MNKKIIKNIFFMFLIISLLFSFGMVFAAGNTALLEELANGKTSNAATAAQNIAGSIITIMKVVATGIAIIMLVVLGIKYMSAAPEEKASIKKSATIYVVGAIILFAVTGILTIIQSFASQIG